MAGYADMPSRRIIISIPTMIKTNTKIDTISYLRSKFHAHGREENHSNDNQKHIRNRFMENECRHDSDEYHQKEHSLM